MRPFIVPTGYPPILSVGFLHLSLAASPGFPGYLTREGYRTLSHSTQVKLIVKMMVPESALNYRNTVVTGFIIVNTNTCSDHASKSKKMNDLTEKCALAGLLSNFGTD